MQEPTNGIDTLRMLIDRWSEYAEITADVGPAVAGAYSRCAEQLKHALGIEPEDKEYPLPI
jgi:hypothetical protein